MSDSEDDFVEFGTALDPLDEDAIPRKRPLTLEDQVVKDAQGRRRFHGAFTGGFSAGFFNTVGSLEGWTPSSFKSSRSERMEGKTQKPQDFMDDEDTGEFGIAPQVLRATRDFSHLKRCREKAPRASDGPIPGEPVLKLLLKPVRETAGVRLLRRMGWRPGQGVGPRVVPTIRQPKHRIVGCAPPPGLGPEAAPASSSPEASSSDEDAVAAGITFAPEDVPSFLCQPKADTFGLGYQGLDRRPVLSGSGRGGGERPLVLGGGRGGTVSVSGQAFGVGALEEEDEDIYTTEDMSQYDFTLGPAPSDQGTRKWPSKAQGGGAWLDNFTRALHAAIKEHFPPPTLPKEFRPQHAPRRTRFDQPPTQEGSSQQSNKVQVRTAVLRAAMVQEEDEETAHEHQRLREEALRLTECMRSEGAGIGNTTFVPFAGHPEKQRRYEQYLALLRAGHPEKLSHLQPLSMSSWERQREKTEFEQAARLFKPLSADMGDRFVSASQPDDATDPLAPVEKLMGATPEQRNAVKMKMFGRLTREEEPWQPCDLLCKRFNIAKPSVNNAPAEAQNRKKASLFDFLKAAPHNTIQIDPPVTTTTSTSSSTTATGPKYPEVPEMIPEPSVEQDSKSENNSIIVDEPEASISEKKEKCGNSPEILFPDPDEKVDLFKAIFLSSSESEEDEEEEEEKQTRSENFTKDDKANKNITSESSHLVASAPAETPKTVPNTPKRSSIFAASAKIGVFANLDLDALSQPTVSSPGTVSKGTESKEKSASSDSSPLDDSMYGPRLPNIVVSGTSSVSRTLPSVVAPPQQIFPPCVWVESTSVHKKKKEKKKKEKKQKEKKSKHKKHKHSKK